MGSVATSDTQRHDTKERSKTMIPHAFTVTILARQRRADFLAEADHQRLAQRARNDRGANDSRCSDRRAAVALLVAIALLFAASAAA
jgi:hypothetical protein